jgi:hypothetical protein
MGKNVLKTAERFPYDLPSFSFGRTGVPLESQTAIHLQSSAGIVLVG